MRTQSSFMRVFGVPLLLGTMTALGLISALLGDGLWDAVSWVGLGTPLLAAGIFTVRSIKQA